MSTATITMPKKVFEDLREASAYFDRAQDQLEDYMLSKNKAFIARAMKARREHKSGKVVKWEDLKAKYAGV